MKLFFKYTFVVTLISTVAIACKKNTGGEPDPDSKDSVITTIAGTGVVGFSGDGGLAANAQLSASAAWVTVDKDGNIYITDAGNRRIRKVSPTGNITTVVGVGSQGKSPDGTQALSLQMAFNEGIFTDANGALLFTDNDLVRKLNANGTITTIAGNGTQFSSNDGDGETATSPKANIHLPQDIIYDASGNLIIADYGHHKIRKVNALTNIITTIAGNGMQGFSGDGGLATAATVEYPLGLAIDNKGNLYVVSDGRVRKITPAGIITTVAGTGNGVFNKLEGVATTVNLWPSDITFNNKDELIIADYGQGLVRKVDANGYLTTIAGSGNSLGDGGKPHLAKFTYPSGVACDANGNIYIADYGARMIRKITVN